MRQGDSLKSYLNFFQNKLTKVSNCGEEVAALTFISGLQVAHPLYKHLLNHNVTKISEILTRAQTYIQLEETMKASSDRPAKPSDGGGKSKSPREAPDHSPERHQGQPAHKRQAFSITSPSSLRDDRSMECFTSSKLLIDKVYNTIKDQSWVRRPRALQHNPSLPGSE